MTTLTGTITDPHGNLVTGYLYFTLSAPGNVLSGACGGPLSVGPGQPVRFVLTSGVISGPGTAPYTIFGNDCMTPSGLYYRMEVFNTNHGFVLRKSVQITGSSVDLGTVASYSPVPPSLSVGGDLSGVASDATVVGLQGTSLPVPSGSAGYTTMLSYDGAFAWASYPRFSGERVTGFVQWDSGNSPSVDGDNVILATTAVTRVTTGAIADFGINAIPNVAHGVQIIINLSGYTMTLVNEDTGILSATYGIHSFSGSDVAVSNNQAVFLHYDSTISRWRPLFITTAGL